MIPDKPTRQEAIELGLTQYNGRKCPVHPHLEGRRRTTKGICVACKNHKRVGQKKRAKKRRAFEEGRCHV